MAERKGMCEDLARILISEEQLRSRIGELGAELTRDYRDKNPIFVACSRAASSSWRTC